MPRHTQVHQDTANRWCRLQTCAMTTIPISTTIFPRLLGLTLYVLCEYQVLDANHRGFRKMEGGRIIRSLDLRRMTAFVRVRPTPWKCPCVSDDALVVPIRQARRPSPFIGCRSSNRHTALNELPAGVPLG